MAWPYTCAGALNAIKYGAADCFTYGDNAITHRQAAWVHWNASQDHEAIEDIMLALYDLSAGMKVGTFSYSPFYPAGALHYYLTECIETPELTIEAMINAMLLADPYEVEYFIGIVDAYKQSIWNQPFNKEFFAALARGFAEWD